MKCHGNSPPFQFRSTGKWTCPTCKTVWQLAGVGPGNYWEKKSEADASIDRLKNFKSILMTEQDRDRILNFEKSLPTEDKLPESG